ncbi:MAG: DUF4167 domain-containing protein [Rhodomicrobium sp.]|nr:DUF4167 domain-containing protein [Rhodomicrobium sp.]
MRQGQQSRRGRNRGGRKPQNSISRNYESSGPDVKIRGTAMHIAEKYASLARDAMSSGDSVAAENYLQHAEHYNRIIMAAQAQNPGIDQPGMNGSHRFNQQEPFQRDFDGDADEEGDAEDFVPQQRTFPERQPYNQNQPQPVIPQNAFPHAQPQLQPVTPAGNGAAPNAGEHFGNQPDGGAPRRRRRRPMGDGPGKGFNGRHSGQGAPTPNGAAAGSDPAPDEAAS